MSQYLRVLRHQDFRRLFLGQAASMTGDRVVVVALALFITRRTGSASDLSLVLAAQSLALIALLAFGGVLADRLARTQIMIWADLARWALHALLAVLILTGAVAVWQITVIEALFGAAQAFFVPAYIGLLPQTVPAELIQDAQALSGAMNNLAFLLGPALATALVLGLGAGVAFALDALTFLISAASLARLRPQPVSAATESILAGLRGGWREVRSRTWVWVVIAVFTVTVLCVFAQWYALAPLVAFEHYGGAGVFGLLETCAGVGALGGTVIGLRWRPRRPLLVGMLAVLAWPLQSLVFALGAPLWLVVPCSLSLGVGFAIFDVFWATALAQQIPAGALSRVSAWDWMGSLALLPVGYLIAGPLAASFGARIVLGVGGVLGFAALGLGLATRSVRRLPAAAGSGARASAEQFARDVGVEAGGEAEVADVDPLV